MRKTTYACALGALMAMACDDSASMGDTDAAIATPFQDQVEWGAMLYGVHCASCHGDAGQGTATGPRVVGLDEGALDARALVSLAKARCSDAGILVANEALQMHGGVGMTDEYDIGFYLKRARAAELTFGDAAWHRERWARLQGY